MVQAPEGPRCPFCGYPVREYWRYCPICGRRLRFQKRSWKRTVPAQGGQSGPPARSLRLSCVLPILSTFCIPLPPARAARAAKARNMPASRGGPRPPETGPPFG